MVFLCVHVLSFSDTNVLICKLLCIIYINFCGNMYLLFSLYSTRMQTHSRSASRGVWPPTRVIRVANTYMLVSKKPGICNEKPDVPNEKPGKPNASL